MVQSCHPDGASSELVPDEEAAPDDNARKRCRPAGRSIQREQPRLHHPGIRAGQVTYLEAADVDRYGMRQRGRRRRRGVPVGAAPVAGRGRRVSTRCECGWPVAPRRWSRRITRCGWRSCSGAART